MKRPPSNQRYLAAVHEAGHAVIAALLDVPIEYAAIETQTIGGIEHIGGHTSNFSHKDNAGGLGDIERRHYLDAWVIVKAAGIAAEMMVGSTEPTTAWDTDLQDIGSMKPVGGTKVIVQLARLIFDQCRGLRRAHAKVRQVLLTTGKIDGKEIRQIVVSTVPKSERDRIRSEIWG